MTSRRHTLAQRVDHEAKELKVALLLGAVGAFLVVVALIAGGVHGQPVAVWTGRIAAVAIGLIAIAYVGRATHRYQRVVLDERRYWTERYATSAPGELDEVAFMRPGPSAPAKVLRPVYNLVSALPLPGTTPEAEVDAMLWLDISGVATGAFRCDWDDVIALEILDHSDTPHTVIIQTLAGAKWLRTGDWADVERLLAEFEARSPVPVERRQPHRFKWALVLHSWFRSHAFPGRLW